MAVRLPAYENFDRYRARVQWQLANALCLLFVPLLLAVSWVNYVDQRLPSAINAAVASGVLATLGLWSWRQGEAAAGRAFYFSGSVILLLLPLVGMLERIDVHFWFYPFPAIVIFVVAGRWLLPVILGYGVYASACLVPVMDGIDVARFGFSYLVGASLIATYAFLVGRASAILRYYSEHDPLTGCLNRRSFHDTMSLSGDADATELWQSLILLDIDHFKGINDRLGHQQGDRVLAEVASVLRRALADGRHPGCAPGRLYRYGGEEFAVMLAGCDATNATALAERLRQTVAAAPVLETPVTLSCGVATWDPRKLPIGRAVDAADRALYEAKRQGRDRVVHSSQLTEAAP